MAMAPFSSEERLENSLLKKPKNITKIIQQYRQYLYINVQSKQPELKFPTEF